MAPKVLRSAFSLFFEYDTPRIVHIRSKKVGVINRLLQATVIGYIIGYVIVYKKGYQDTDAVQGAVTTKLKGVAMTNFSDEYPGISGARVWDVGDYVQPPLENNAFFMMTNVLITPKQSQDVCPEDPGIEGSLCKTDADCPANTPIPIGNGWRTGKCVVNNATGTPVNTCEIYAWCPVENSRQKKPPEPVLIESQNFTVFIKNNIEFPKFGLKRRNIVGFQNDTQLMNCRNNGSDSLCPIFIIGDIVKYANEPDFFGLAKSGGVIQILISWNCNLDHDEDDCKPAYSFRRLDKANYTTANGFNFRYGRYFKENNIMVREYIKAYGIRFVVTLEGTAGKFSVVPLMLNIGSGIALLGIATIVCDIIVLYILKAKKMFYEKKYLTVNTADAYNVLEESEHEKSVEGSCCSTGSTDVRRRAAELPNLNCDE